MEKLFPIFFEDKNCDRLIDRDEFNAAVDLKLQEFNDSNLPSNEKQKRINDLNNFKKTITESHFEYPLNFEEDDFGGSLKLMHCNS